MEQTLVDLIPLSATHKPVCEVHIQQTSRNHFNLREQWTFLVHVQTTFGTPIIERSYHAAAVSVQGLVLFLFCVLFAFTRAQLLGYGVALGAAFLVPAGGNLLEAFRLVGSSAFQVFAKDRYGWGLLFFGLWIGWVSSPAKKGVRPSPRFPPWLMKVFAVVLGILHPVILTLVSKASGFARSYPVLLRLQLIVAGLSLALFSANVGETWPAIRANLLLPRYLTLGLLLFGILSFRRWKVPRLALLRLPYRFYFLCLVLSETIAYASPLWRNVSVVTRIGFSLCVVEGLLYRRLDRKITLDAFRPAGAVLLGLLFSRYATNSGLSDFLTVFWNPLLHPNHLPVFTLIGTAATVLFSGSPTIAFFSFYPLLLNAEVPTVARAALFDGLLLGWVLSPYSLLNVIPIVGLGHAPLDVFRERLYQLRLPLLIAFWVYSTTNLPLVEILRPITFIFLWLVTLTILMYRSNWNLRRALSS